MTEFKRETHTVNGVKIILLTAGSGEPLLFLHGAGTFHGFEFAKPWADKFRDANVNGSREKTRQWHFVPIHCRADARSDGTLADDFS